MFERIYVKNPLTGNVYEAFQSNDNPFHSPFFKKKIMMQIVKDINNTNKNYSCDICFKYDRKSDSIICEDNEFHKHLTSNYCSHMIYTPLGMMKLYYFGNEIDWEIINTTRQPSL